VVVVARQRHGAARAGDAHRVRGIRPAPDHVPERPELVGAARLGRREHRVQRLGVGMGIAEHRHAHPSTVRERGGP